MLSGSEWVKGTALGEAGGQYLSWAGQTRRYNQASPLIDCAMAAGPRPLLDALFARESAED